MINIKTTAYFLIILGSISLGLQGVFGIDLVGSIFGTSVVLTKLVYFLIGVSGLYGITHLKLSK